MDSPGGLVCLEGKTAGLHCHSADSIGKGWGCFEDCGFRGHYANCLGSYQVGAVRSCVSIAEQKLSLLLVLCLCLTGLGGKHL